MNKIYLMYFSYKNKKMSWVQPNAVNEWSSIETECQSCAIHSSFRNRLVPFLLR